MGLVAISHLYNAIFKAKGILGSFTLPLGIGFLSVFGALAVSGTVPRMVWYAFAATTLYDFGTHITTTFKDISRDRQLGILTTPLQIGVGPALLLSAIATVAAFVAAFLPYWLEPELHRTYVVWVMLGIIATIGTRIPLYVQPNEKNGYFALKGSMVGSILFFPCLIGAQVSLAISAAVIVPLLLVTLYLLKTTHQEV